MALKIVPFLSLTITDIGNTVTLTMKSRPTQIDPTEVKVELIRRGTNMRRWAHSHGFDQSSVWRAVHQSHVGKVSERMRKMLRRELGL